MKSAEAVIDNNQSKKSSVRYALKIIGNIFISGFIILGIILSIYLLGQRFLPKKLSSIPSYKIFIVHGGSMSPEFKEGSVVFVKEIAPVDIKVGDIVSFKSSSSTHNIVTHRVSHIDKGNELAFTTEGDANNIEDPEKLHPENIIGKVHFSIPFIGYILNFAKTKFGLFFLVVLPGILLIVYEIFKIFGFLKNKDVAEKTPALALEKEESRPLQSKAIRSFSQDYADVTSIEERKILNQEKPAETFKTLTKIEEITSALSDIQNEIEKAIMEIDEKSFIDVLDKDIKLENYRKKLKLILEQY